MNTPGRHVSVAGQVGQETFELLFAGEGRSHSPQRADVTAQPVGVAGFSGNGLVLAADDLPQSLNAECRLHDRPSSSQEGLDTGRPIEISSGS